MVVEVNTSSLPRIFVTAPCPSCVTVTVWPVTPVPVIVNVAVRELVPVFAEFAVTVTIASFDPAEGDTSSQLTSSVILQSVLEDIVNVPFDPADDPVDIADGDTFRLGAIPDVV